MKYMTFNNSCFFAAVATLLEDYKIDVSDKDIIKDSLIPYVFRYNKVDCSFESGYQIQDFEIIDDFLKQFIFKLEEKEFNQSSLIERKETLIKELTVGNNKKIVSLKLYDDQNKWHATVFDKVEEGIYHFINMKRENDDQENIKLTHNELLEKLADNTKFAYINRINSFVSIDKRRILNDSLETLKNYKKAILENMSTLQNIEERLHTRDLLYKPLLLNYVDVTNIIGDKALYQELQSLQRKYIDTFKIKDSIKLSEHISTDSITGVLEEIKEHIKNKLPTTYYHGSKVSGIKELIPNISIHDKEYVYLTTKKEVALLYTVNAVEVFLEKNNIKKPDNIHPWYSYGFDKGKLVIEEYYKNAFIETYKGRSGYLYITDEPTLYSNMTNIFCAVTTEEKVSIKEEILIKDIYEELLLMESKGIIDIRYYEGLSNKVKEARLKSIEGTIKHFDLHNKPDNHYTLFLQNKFPDLFK